MAGVKDKIKENKIKVVKTDKTNNMSVMHPETYQKSMKKHYEKDKEIDKKELNKIERKLNEHLKDCVRIFKVAESHGQHKRAIINATVHVNGQLPALVGNEKDHK